MQVYYVNVNRWKNRGETTYVKGVYGTCCWKVLGRDKQKQIFTAGMRKTPNSAYFYKIYASKTFC